MLLLDRDADATVVTLKFPEKASQQAVDVSLDVTSDVLPYHFEPADKPTLKRGIHWKKSSFLDPIRLIACCVSRKAIASKIASGWHGLGLTPKSYGRCCLRGLGRVQEENSGE